MEPVVDKDLDFIAPFVCKTGHNQECKKYEGTSNSSIQSSLINAFGFSDSPFARKMTLNFIGSTNSVGVFTLAYSGTETETGTGTGIMRNLSHCTKTGTGTGKNGLYGFDKSLSHCIWTGTGTGTRKKHYYPMIKALVFRTGNIFRT